MIAAALLRLADATPATSPSATPDPNAPDFVTTGSWVPGLLSLAAFVFLAAAIWVIYRSMNSRLKKVDFPEQPGEPRSSGRSATEPGPPAA